MDFLRKKKSNKQKLFLENGSILLEELIASFDGKCNPIRSFSAEQILKATNHFDESCIISRWGYFIWCKGIIDDRPVLIKKWSMQDLNAVEEVYRDIVVPSQMSSHKNVLKLLGCGLEFDLPVLVCEYAEHGPLNRQGGVHSGDTLPWNIRLKIAKEIANAVTYLHTAFPRTIVHRNINPTNIFLDKNWTPKLSDFWFCISIPEGEAYVEDPVKGVIGFVDPDYYQTRKVTESVDVYGFGVLMLVLLSGKSAVISGPGGTSVSLRDHLCDLMENTPFMEILDPGILQDTGEAAGEMQLSQIEAF